MKVPGNPGVWVFVAFAQLPLAYFLPGRVIWPVPLIALAAMIAAVTRAYQDAARHRTESIAEGEPER